MHPLYSPPRVFRSIPLLLFADFLIFVWKCLIIWWSEGFFQLYFELRKFTAQIQDTGVEIWRITSLFSRLQLKYRLKFDQLTHCYTLFTVLDVGDTGKNEVELKEVEVSPVSELAHGLHCTRYQRLCFNADCLLCSPVWLAVIFLKKRCDMLQESVKRRQFLTSATTTTVIYIFIYSKGYPLVLEPSQAGKRGKICTGTVQSDSWVTVNKENKHNEWL